MEPISLAIFAVSCLALGVADKSGQKVAEDRRQAKEARQNRE